MPSRFNRDGLPRAAASTQPVHVMPLGVDVDHFHPGIRAVPNPRGRLRLPLELRVGRAQAARAAPQGLQPDLPARRTRSSSSARSCNRDPRRQRPRARSRSSASRRPGAGSRSSTTTSSPTTSSASSTARPTATSRPAAARAGTCRSWRRWPAASRRIATDWGAHTEFVHDGISYPLRVRAPSRAVAKCPYYDGLLLGRPRPRAPRAPPAPRLREPRGGGGEGAARRGRDAARSGPGRTRRGGSWRGWRRSRPPADAGAPGGGWPSNLALASAQAPPFGARSDSGRVSNRPPAAYVVGLCRAVRWSQVRDGCTSRAAQAVLSGQVRRSTTRSWCRFIPPSRISRTRKHRVHSRRVHSGVWKTPR